MKKTTILLGLILLLSGISFTEIACLKKEKKIETELTTTVKVLLHDTARNIRDTFIWSDVDGPGGNNPTTGDTLRLKINTKYLVQLEFLNESGPFPLDITLEILQDAKDHLVCYQIAPNLMVDYLDSDGKYPLGISTAWQAVSQFLGQMQLELKHQPGIKNGNCDIGETDISITIPIIIE